MSIEGIDQEKCSKCGKCVEQCRYFSSQEDGSIKFNHDLVPCNICGRCIAVCPKDAILTKNLDDIETTLGIDASKTMIPHPTIHQFLRTKRSMRSYKKKTVPEDLINHVFEAMRYSPSGSNARVWKFLLLSQGDLIHKMSQLTIEQLYPYMGYASAQEALSYFDSIKKDPIFYDAPHVIFLYYADANMDIKDDQGNSIVTREKVVNMRALDAGITLTYGMLAAESLGLGTCWIGLASAAMARNSKIKDLVQIDGEVFGVFTLGYPAVKYFRPAPRLPLDIKKIE